MEELIKVGAITQTHGIKGELKVFPMTDNVKRFKKGTKLILKTKSETLDVTVKSARPQKNLVIIGFEEFDNINLVEKYKGADLFVEESNRVKCQKDEYFISDIIDMKVVDESGKELGQIYDVLTTGANDVYDIRGGEVDFLLPAIKDCILNVDLKAKVMTVFVLPGLID